MTNHLVTIDYRVWAAVGAPCFSCLVHKSLAFTMQSSHFPVSAHPVVKAKVFFYMKPEIQREWEGSAGTGAIHASVFSCCCLFATVLGFGARPRILQVLQGRVWPRSRPPDARPPNSSLVFANSKPRHGFTEPTARCQATEQ